MYEMILVLHVVTMIGSLTLMSGAVAAGLLGKRVAVTIATSGMVATMTGFITGVGLMLDAPLTLKCAMLTAYLVAVTTLYYIGYGFGNVEKARFVRSLS